MSFLGGTKKDQYVLLFANRERRTRYIFRGVGTLSLAAFVLMEYRPVAWYYLTAKKPIYFPGHGNLGNKRNKSFGLRTMISIYAHVPEIPSI